MLGAQPIRPGTGRLAEGDPDRPFHGRTPNTAYAIGGSEPNVFDPRETGLLYSYIRTLRQLENALYARAGERSHTRYNQSVTRVAVSRGVQLPFGKAYEFALQNIRIRFWRSMITAGGVFLGIAFLASVLTDRAVAGSHLAPQEAARLQWLAALSLLVCAVGITNSMLMSVSERFREIGTMKCLGALDQFIVKIFMIEALLIGLLASALGWGLGTGLSILSKIVQGVPANAPAGTTALGALTGQTVISDLAFCVGIGAGLTALATYLPARQAASIPPAAALRTDV